MFGWLRKPGVVEKPIAVEKTRGVFVQRAEKREVKDAPRFEHNGVVQLTADQLYVRGVDAKGRVTVIVPAGDVALAYVEVVNG